MGDVLRFPVNMKFAWQEQMALDRDLSSVDFHVGFLIGKHVNKFSGLGIVSMETLALLIGRHVSTVKRSIGVLEARAHIRVHRRDLGLRKDGRPVSGGRVANRYEPLLKSRPQVNCFEGTNEAVSRPQVDSLRDAVSRSDRAGKQIKSAELADHGRSPYPYKNPFQRKNQDRASAGPQRGVALELGAFEIILARHIGIDHSTLIERCEQGTLSALHRKFRAGVDIMHDIGDLRVKLITENAEGSRSSEQKRGAS
jgi:hypothetical protein